MAEIPEIFVHSWSDDARLQPLYTGLTALRRAGLLRLRQQIEVNPERLGLPGLKSGSSHLLLTLGDGRRLLYDTTDSGQLDEALVRSSDAYFKRSYDPRAVADLGPLSVRVHPLGLNYPVYPNRPDWMGLRRALSFGPPRQRLLQSLRLLDVGSRWSQLPREHHLDREPDPGCAARVLFLVRAWDPEEFPGCTPERRRHYGEVNEMRAACVRALRREFGELFTGGFSHTAFARRQFPDALAPDPSQTHKRSYLRLLERHPICVTSGGLHGSLGWKLGEYVALSKAIVTERLAFAVPGSFAEDVHYLAYDDAEGCVASVRRLVEDQEQRAAMMAANRAYFLEHLRPDRLVWNSLAKALRLSVGENGP